MISFIFGGAGGIVNASSTLDTVVHNTAWIPGHFHITVGTATTLTFMGSRLLVGSAPDGQELLPA